MSAIFVAAALQLAQLPHVPPSAELLPPLQSSHRVAFDCASGSYAFTYRIGQRSGGRTIVSAIERGADPGHLAKLSVGKDRPSLQAIELAGEVESVTAACLGDAGAVLVHTANGPKRQTFRVLIGRDRVAIDPI